MENYCEKSYEFDMIPHKISLALSFEASSIAIH